MVPDHGAGRSGALCAALGCQAGGQGRRGLDSQSIDQVQPILTLAAEDPVMAENQTDTQTLPVRPHPSWAVPAGDADAPPAPAPATPAPATPAAATPESGAPAPAAPASAAPGGPAAHPGPALLDENPRPAEGSGVRDRLRTPIAGALLGGVVILGVGFGAGYVVGHDRGASASTGPGGQFSQGGQGGPFGQFSQGGQLGQPGQGGQFGQGVPGGQLGQGVPGGQAGQTGQSDDGATGFGSRRGAGDDDQDGLSAGTT
jgi:hypothetical protein